MSRRPTLLIVGLLAAVALASLAGTVRPVGASPSIAPAESPRRAQNETCLACHASPGQTITLPSSEPLYISVEAEVFEDSVHGQQGLACVDCHPGNAEFPHPAVTAQSRREYVLQRYTACAECHADKYKATLDSVHQKALAGGNLKAAVCTDCHGAHDIRPIAAAPRSAIPQTCERCHSAIYSAYRDSVHGADL